MNIIKTGLLIMGSVLSMVANIQAKPINMRILKHDASGRVDIFIDDMHESKHEENVDQVNKSRIELRELMKKLGDNAACIVEDMIEEGRHKKMDELMRGRPKNETFLSGLYGYLKDNNIKVYNAECRFGDNFSVSDALKGASEALEEIKEYNDPAWDDYYERGIARVTQNVDSWQKLVAQLSLNPGWDSSSGSWEEFRQVMEEVDGICAVLRSVMRYSDLDINDPFAWHGDLVDMRATHFREQGHKKYTVHVFGKIHNDTLITLLKNKGSKERFNFKQRCGRNDKTDCSEISIAQASKRYWSNAPTTWFEKYGKPVITFGLGAAILAMSGYLAYKKFSSNQGRA